MSSKCPVKTVVFNVNERKFLKRLSGRLKKHECKCSMTVGESICQQKRENNKSIYKISKFRNCWLTVLTNGFNKSKL